jgi:hypothetical protein
VWERRQKITSSGKPYANVMASKKKKDEGWEGEKRGEKMSEGREGSERWDGRGGSSSMFFVVAG